MMKRMAILVLAFFLLFGTINVPANAATHPVAAKAAAAAVDPLSCYHGSTVMTWTHSSGGKTIPVPSRSSLTNFCLRSTDEDRRVVWTWRGDLQVKQGLYSGGQFITWGSHTEYRGKYLHFGVYGEIEVLDANHHVIWAMPNHWLTNFGTFHLSLAAISGVLTAHKSAFREWCDSSRIVYMSVYQTYHR
jgi:hypothetical protein